MANLPVPAPRSAQPSEVETSAYQNTVRDALNFLLNRPEAKVIQAVAQSLANATLTAITFDATTIDFYGGHSNSTNNSRYTAQVAGWYWVYGTVGFVANATGSRVAQIYKNGTGITDTQVWSGNDGGNPTSVNTGSLVPLNVGDYVELFGYQTSGGALNTQVNGPQSAFHVVWDHA